MRQCLPPVPGQPGQAAWPPPAKSTRSRTGTQWHAGRSQDPFPPAGGVDGRRHRRPGWQRACACTEAGPRSSEERQAMTQAPGQGATGAPRAAEPPGRHTGAVHPDGAQKAAQDARKECGAPGAGPCSSSADALPPPHAPAVAPVHMLKHLCFSGWRHSRPDKPRMVLEQQERLPGAAAGPGAHQHRGRRRPCHACAPPCADPQLEAAFCAEMAERSRSNDALMALTRVRQRPDPGAFLRRAGMRGPGPGRLRRHRSHLRNACPCCLPACLPAGRRDGDLRAAGVVWRPRGAGGLGGCAAPAAPAGPPGLAAGVASKAPQVGWARSGRQAPPAQPARQPLTGPTPPFNRSCRAAGCT